MEGPVFSAEARRFSTIARNPYDVFLMTEHRRAPFVAGLEVVIGVSVTAGEAYYVARSLIIFSKVVARELELRIRTCCTVTNRGPSTRTLGIAVVRPASAPRSRSIQLSFADQQRHPHRCPRCYLIRCCLLHFYRHRWEFSENCPYQTPSAHIFRRIFRHLRHRTLLGLYST